MKSNINIINPFLLKNKKDRDSFPLKLVGKNVDKIFKIKSSKSNKFFLISKDNKTNSLSIIHLSSSLLTKKENSKKTNSLYCSLREQWSSITTLLDSSIHRGNYPLRVASKGGSEIKQDKLPSIQAPKSPFPFAPSYSEEIKEKKIQKEEQVSTNFPLFSPKGERESKLKTSFILPPRESSVSPYSPVPTEGFPMGTKGPVEGIKSPAQKVDRVSEGGFGGDSSNIFHIKKNNSSYDSKKKIGSKTILSCSLNSRNNSGGSNKEIISLLSLLETNSKFSNQLKGIQFKIAGRLRGAQRARSILLNHGRISTQTFNSSLKFNKKQIYTKWGTWGSSIYISRSTFP